MPYRSHEKAIFDLQKLSYGITFKIYLIYYNIYKFNTFAKIWVSSHHDIVK